jgi:dihydrofolate reductase
MGKIVMSENVSLDGVVQDPAGDEGFRLGGWVGKIQDREDLYQVTLDEALGAEALLLGRRSYEWLAARWPSRTGELADRLNSLPKYVVSSTLEHPEWNNTTVLTGDVVNEVSTLKQELDGEIVIPASFQLLRTLVDHDLVDELRLKIYPVVLGAGERLFGETTDEKPMRLIDEADSPSSGTSTSSCSSSAPSWPTTGLGRWRPGREQRFTSLTAEFQSPNSCRRRSPPGTRSPCRRCAAMSPTPWSKPSAHSPDRAA